jgi:hypothetical protein
MSYQSIRYMRLKSQLATVQASLTALYNTLSEQSASGVVSYKFESGEGGQSTTRRGLDEILKSIRELEATEAHIINELYNVGIVAMRLRRKS